MRVAVLLVLLALTACSTDNVRPGPPPEIIEVPVRTYVPIDPALTERCVWPRNERPSQVFIVSRQRRLCLEKYELNLGAIERLQGKPVPAER